MHRRDFLSTAVASIVGGAAAIACAEELQELSAINGVSGSGATHLRSKLDNIETRLALPAIGGVAVSRKAIVDRAACGFCKMGESDRVTDHSHWQIGSITKTFTATLTALLVDRGKLSWDTTLGEFYPQHVSLMADGVSGITVRQIITHKSGMERNDPFPWEGTPELNGPGLSLSQRRQRGVVFALGAKLEFPPGSKYSYSNRAYETLGAALERVAGRSYEDLIVSEIAKPLGMKSPMFGEPGLTGPREPWPHVLEGKHLKPVPPAPREWYGYHVCCPAGGITLTLDDFGRWMHAHLVGEQAGGILSREMFKTIHTPEDQGGVPAFGIGQHAVFGRTLSHTGSNMRNYAMTSIFPDAGVGVMLAVNAVPPENVPADFFIYNSLMATALPGKWPQPAFAPPSPDNDGMIEGESLEVVRLNGGNLEFQSFRQLSKQFQLWWKEAKDGNKLMLRVDVPTAGRYTIEASCAHYQDIGDVTFAMGNLERRVKFHSPNLVWKTVDFGEATLNAGPHKILITAHGSAGQNGIFCHLGLDTLRLRPAGASATD